MKKSLLTLALAATLSVPAFAADQYLVRVPANVNLSAAEPETPQDPISLSLSAEALPAATVNEPYSFNLLDRLTITGGSGSHNYSDTAWSLKAGDALPPGLSLSGSMIAGTPTAKNEAGTSFEVTGTYQDASGQQVYTIVVGGQVLKATQLSAGAYHTCAITTKGSVKCWGRNEYGQLGDGTLIDRSRPVDVLGLSSGFVRVETGYYETCAKNIHGQLYCWGANGSGQIGIGTFSTTITAPTHVSSIAAVKDFALGNGTVCAVSAEGLKCWGSNNTGKLGDNSYSNKSVPTSVLDIYDVVDVTVSQSHVCAVTSAGSLMCWGQDHYGELGYSASNTSQTRPIQVDGLSSGVKSVETKHATTCAVMNNGGVKCWGFNGGGQVGNGTKTQQDTPVDVVDLEGFVVEQVKVGFNYTCARSVEGLIKCWGSIDGQPHALRPNDLPFLNNEVVDLSVGGSSACAITLSGSVKCWGDNTNGQLGDGTKTDRTTPVDVLP